MYYALIRCSCSLQRSNYQFLGNFYFFKHTFGYIPGNIALCIITLSYVENKTI